MTTTTTSKKTLTIRMSERRPIKIVEDDWPVIAKGSAFSGEHSFQAYDAAWIRVRRHSDGRMIVYGYAGDGDGGGRPTREGRTAGFLLAKEDDEVRTIRRVAGILAATECIGELAHRAARGCIANLPAETEPAEGDAPAEVKPEFHLLATLLALLVRARPYCPEDLQAEIKAAISGKAAQS